jgi:hypothetical protein
MSKASLELGGGNWGTKDGNLLAYAQGNESSNLVPREFTFTRGSDIAATRITSSGLIEKYRENLLLQSNQFDTAWSDELLGSIVSGQSGYDGTNDAWLLNKGEYQYRRILQTLSPSVSGIWTLSVYAKEGTTSIMNLRDMTNAYRVEFDLSGSGSVSAAFGNISSKIESVGNGWFRCSATFNSTSSSIGIYVGWNDSTASNIYIQDAQLEQGLVATSYLESGATTATSGVADNEPRIDYAGGTASLLLEPQRTNLIPYSEYFGGWNLFNRMTPTANDATSPEGLQNAYKIETTDTGAYFRDAQTISAGNNVFSIFAKKGNARYIFLASRFFNGFTDTYVWFDIENGTKGGRNGESFDYDIEDYGNGWYRCYLVHNVDASDLFGYAYVGLTNTDLNTSGEGGLNGYFYGGQWEEGSYPTSYIPTYGTSDTRNQDQASFAYDAATTSWSVFMDVKNWTDVSNSGQFSFRNIADTTNSLFYYGACFGVQKSVGQEYSCGKLSNYEVYNGKFAITYDGVNTVKIYVDGVLRDTITTADTAKTAGIDGGNLYYAGSSASKEIKSLLLFPTALTDDECIALTTL